MIVCRNCGARLMRSLTVYRYSNGRRFATVDYFPKPSGIVALLYVGRAQEERRG